MEAIVAPPTFTEVRYQYLPDSAAMRPRFDRPWFGSGREASGTPGVHPPAVDFALEHDGDIALPAETHFEYFEPIRPGDVLSMHENLDRTWQKQTSRAGLVTFFDVTRVFRNQRGEIAVMERVVWFISTRGVEAG